MIRVHDVVKTPAKAVAFVALRLFWSIYEQSYLATDGIRDGQTFSRMTAEDRD